MSAMARMRGLFDSPVLSCSYKSRSAVDISSFFHDQLAELLVRQEEFHGIKLLKELLQASVVEYERRRAAAGLADLEGVEIQDAEGGVGRQCATVRGVKEGQQLGQRFHQAHQAVHRGREQRGVQMLQQVPDEHAIEVLIGVVERLAQKAVNLAWIGLAGGVLEGAPKDAQKVLGIEFMTEAGNEIDVLLVSA